MPAIGEVVELDNGDVGVVAEALPLDQWRVYFPEGHLDILEAAIAETLDAPSYEVGQTVSVWPHQGTIKTLGSSEVTVTLDRSEHIPGVGTPQWQPDVTIPLWRLIRDNDSRLERDL